ncbi:MAG: putative peptidoglycan glycosyltransferase FtsW [bacterium]|nr:putative peptidoglycan glycosyltransferase FtsW [bacterium]
MNAKKSDVVFLTITIILFLAGFFILASASLGMAAKTDKNAYYPLLKQIIIGGVGGFILLLTTSRIHYKNWRKWALFLFIFSFLLTLLVLVPKIGFWHGGAKRWLSLGSFSFQPSELLKFSFVVYLSSWLAKRKNEIGSFRSGLLPFLIIAGFAAVALVLQPDIGTLGVMCLTGAILFFLAGGKFTQIGIVILAGLAILAILIFVNSKSAKPYMKARVLVFMNNSADTQGSGYQLNQAKIALGSGGIFGRGFGQGLSKFNNLPEPMGDSIFAIVGEEFGFLGTVSIVFLFVVFLYRAMAIASSVPDNFGRLLVSGIAILIVLQAFINMYAIVGLVPLTGLPLIFISQGGSALAIAMAEIGVILNISKYRRI